MKNKYERVNNYIIYFILYAIIGWIYEVLLELLVWKHGFVNRGTLVGPWLPVYGVGALMFIFSIYPIIKEKPLRRKLILLPVVFFGCMFIASTSIRFGLGGVFFLYVLEPLFEKICLKLGNKVKLISYIIIGILLIDVIYSFIIK